MTDAAGPTLGSTGPTFNIIACQDAAGGIGCGRDLPWKNMPTTETCADMKWFREWTRGATVIMGRKTFQSCGALPGRVNIVVTSKCIMPGGPKTPTVIIARDLDAALGAAPVGRGVWVIGGAQLYRCALAHPALEYAYVNTLTTKYECDVTMPEITLARNDNILGVGMPQSVQVYAGPSGKK